MISLGQDADWCTVKGVQLQASFWIGKTNVGRLGRQDLRWDSWPEGMTRAMGETMIAWARQGLLCLGAGQAQKAMLTALGVSWKEAGTRR